MTLTLGTGPLAAGAPTTTNYVFDGPQHQLLFISFPRRIRAVLAGQTIVDSERVMLLHESNIFPVLYFPRDDISMDLLEQTAHSTHCPFKGDATYWTIRAGDTVAENAVWGYETPIESASWLEGYLAIEWSRIDQWFDEDDEIFGHIRDPYHRVDARPTSRHYQVRIAGHLVADTTNSFVVSETGGPNRHYIPAADIRTNEFTKSDTTTHCPHKGDTVYWHHSETQTNDIAWSYPAPLEEATRIAGHWCFDGPNVEITRAN
ncbi:MAG: DUF427 domain-containing protein [Acidimicrobiia bacterium]|nr:DUF427 domain-containing protein [Acidimicrobiia bacterium]